MVMMLRPYYEFFFFTKNGFPTDALCFVIFSEYKKYIYD